MREIILLPNILLIELLKEVFAWIKTKLDLFLIQDFKLGSWQTFQTSKFEFINHKPFLKIKCASFEIKKKGFNFDCNCTWWLEQLRKGPKKGLLDISNGNSLEDEASPLVLAVASSPRISRKRLGSTSNTAEQFKDDNLPGSLHSILVLIMRYVMKYKKFNQYDFFKISSYLLFFLFIFFHIFFKIM